MNNDCKSNGAWIVVVAILVLLLGFFASRPQNIDSIIRDNVMGVSAICKDGSYSTAKTRRGACSDHGGIRKWFEK